MQGRYDREVTTTARRILLAAQMHEFGVQMYRQRMLREQPEASVAEINELVRAWLHTRPGAEHGDAVGTPSARFG